LGRLFMISENEVLIQYEDRTGNKYCEKGENYALRNFITCALH